MKTEIKKMLSNAVKDLSEAGYKLEPMTETKSRFIEKYGQINCIFAYSRWCEMNFEANLREDYKRKTTFTADFSLAEWCETSENGKIFDTFKRCVRDWCNNHVYFAELVIAINMKSWEHSARGNYEMSRMYADMYYMVKDMYFEAFSDDEEAIDYYYDYVD